MLYVPLVSVRAVVTTDWVPRSRNSTVRPGLGSSPSVTVPVTVPVAPAVRLIGVVTVSFAVTVTFVSNC
jgi:hypothetical protein